MQSSIKRVELALQDLKQGKMIVLTDDPGRENEGDIIIAAEHITPETMNFLIRNGSGIVCVALTKDYLKRLNLPLMVTPNENTSTAGTPFTISVDANEGTTTGVSAADRVQTIQVILNEQSTPDDLLKPGHIFPLRANEDGVFARRGHTEGAVDLAKLAGCKSAAVLCEIMNPDGTMTRGEQLIQFAATHNLTLLSIEDIVNYRLHHEYMIGEEASASFPLEKYGTFKVTVVKEKFSSNEHVILSKERTHSNTVPLVRIHSSCLTGDLFASKRCDCHKQLHYSLQRISEEGGLLIYLNQEGRGIGLFNKIKAYALQEQGFDTVDANTELGLPVDSRKYVIAAHILRNLKINHVRLLTNNPNKVDDLKNYGVSHVDREAMPSFDHEYNHFYLKTKKLKLKHIIDFDLMSEINIASVGKGSL